MNIISLKKVLGKEDEEEENIEPITLNQSDLMTKMQQMLMTKFLGK